MKFKKLYGAFIVSLTTLFIATTLYAQMELKIGYIDSNEIINQLPELKEIETKLTALFEQKRDELTTKTDAYEKAVQQYQQQQNLLSNTQRSLQADRLQSLQNEIVQFQRTIENEIELERDKYMQPLFTKINNSIEAIAKRLALDIVLNKKTSLGDSIIFFADQKQRDITEDVIKDITSKTN